MYSSAASGEPPSMPPVTGTRPSGSKEAVWSHRADSIGAFGVQIPVAGLYNSADA